VIDNEALINSF